MPWFLAIVPGGLTKCIETQSLFKILFPGFPLVLFCLSKSLVDFWDIFDMSLNSRTVLPHQQTAKLLFHTNTGKQCLQAAHSRLCSCRALSCWRLWERSYGFKKWHIRCWHAKVLCILQQVPLCTCVWTPAAGKSTCVYTLKQVWGVGSGFWTSCQVVQGSECSRWI